LQNEQLQFASRNQQVVEFRGFPEWCQQRTGLYKLLTDNPNLRLYGEWLVKHTVNYRLDAFNCFYLFDAFDCAVESFLTPTQVVKIAEYYDVPITHTFGSYMSPTIEELEQHVGKSEFAANGVGEGIVIKNPDFRNKYGECVYAKLVRKEFKEESAANFLPHKSEDFYWEAWTVEKFCTPARFQKILAKIELATNEQISDRHIGQLISTMQHDILTEEITTIAKKAPSINFNRLNKYVAERTRKMYFEGK